MFERSSSWQRYKGDEPRSIRLHLGHVPELPSEEEGRGVLRIAVVAAVLLHVGLFLLQLPESASSPLVPGPRQPVYVVRQVRFKPPPPKAQEQIPKPRETRRRIPIPDPTPDEPEPIVSPEIEVPEVDSLALDAIYGVPDAPPAPGWSGPAPHRVGGGVSPPVRIHAPQPRYTEEARQARIQGVVILEAIIDQEGRVRAVRVLKDLPMGLAESAVETVREWRFEPARLDGRPVPVYYNLTVRFSLQ